MSITKSLKLNNKGDTIMEVLIAVAVLSLILVTSFALANRSSQATRQANERAEANKYVSAEVEKIKYYLGQSAAGVPGEDEFYCLTGNSPDYDLTEADVSNDLENNFREANACKKGTDGRYVVVFKRTGNTYSIYGRWDSVTGKTVDKINAVHRIYPNIASGPAVTNPVGGTPPVVVPVAADTHRFLGGFGQPANCDATISGDGSRTCLTTGSWNSLYACVPYKATYSNPTVWTNAGGDYKTVKIWYSNANCATSDPQPLGSNGPTGFFSAMQNSPYNTYKYQVEICINGSVICSNASLAVPGPSDSLSGIDFLPNGDTIMNQSRYHEINIPSGVNKVNSVNITWFNDTLTSYPVDVNLKIIAVELR